MSIGKSTEPPVALSARARARLANRCRALIGAILLTTARFAFVASAPAAADAPTTPAPTTPAPTTPAPTTPDDQQAKSSQVATSPSPTVSPVPPCTLELHGHVVDAITHEPLGGAQIEVQPPSPGAGPTLEFTDATGHFTMATLCDAAVIVVSADGYEANETRRRVGMGSAVEIALTPKRGETIEIRDHAPAPTELRAATTVSGADLLRTRGRSFTEALRDVAGVAKLGSGTDAGKPVVRGLFGRRIALFVDGLRHRSQEWGLDHAPEVDPFAAGKISVVRGTAAVEYGPDALGGTIAVEAPPMLREPGLAAELHAITTVRGLGGTLAGRLRGVPRAAPHWAWLVDGSYRQAAAPSSPDYALQNTGAREGNASASAAYTRGATEYQVTVRHYQAVLGVCTCFRADSIDDFLAAATQARPPDAAQYASHFAIARPYQDVMHETALARARWERPAGVIAVQYGYQFDWRREFDQVRSAITSAQFEFALQSHDAQLTFEHHPRHVGANWHLRGKLGARGDVALHRYAGLPLIPSYTSAGGAVFVQERLLGHDTELAIGARYDVLARNATIAQQDFARLVRSGQLTADACGAQTETSVPCRSRFHLVSASVGALQSLTAFWTVKAELSTAMRPPNPDEQYLNGTAPTFPVLGLGKPDLRAEHTLASSITSEIRTKKLTAEASIFANFINDYINFAPALDSAGQPIFDVLIRGTFPRFTTNPVDARFLGADGALRWQLHPHLALAASVAVVRARNRDTHRYLALIPADRMRLTAQWQPSALGPLREPFVRIGATLVAKQTRTDSSTDFVPAPAGYAIFDAELGSHLKLGTHHLQIALTGQNLSNQRYRDYTSLNRYFVDQPGWQAALRLSYFFGAKDST